MYFDLIKSNLKSLHMQTRLLEACNWDEEELQETLEAFQVFLDNLPIPKKTQWKDFREIILSYSKNTFGEQLGDIFINIIDHEKDHMIKLLNLEEQ